MEQLPPHVATADEPMSALSGRNLDGPDMRHAASIADILLDLHRFGTNEDVVGYVECFRCHLRAIGIDMSVMIERNGDEHLMVGGPCDGHTRHRSRWVHFMFEDLDSNPERREYLMHALMHEGRVSDNRPPNPRATTLAIRAFLRAGGRILIEPDGTLSEGGGVPPAFTHGSEEEAAECMAASQAYFAVRRRWRSEHQIKRAVRMLGERTGTGWMVLEARS